jgi:hypothetical protein
VSYQAVTWAMYDAPILLTDKKKPDTTARQVLAILAEHANATGGNSYPSVLRISYATGLDERTIDRVLKRLITGGLIRSTGRLPEGTRIWQLALDVVRDPAEWDWMVAQANATRELESARRRARRHRSSCADEGSDGGDVRHGESRTSGTQSTGVRDAECRMSGTERPPNHQEEPPMNRPGTSPGGSPAPRPPRPLSPSAPGTESENVTQHPSPPSPRPTAQLPTARETALAAMRATFTRRPRTA